MRRIILNFIEFFGRYTAIIIFGAVLSLATFWLSYLDSHPKLVIVSGVIVIPLCMISFALLIGLFFSGLRKRTGEFVTRQEAPKIWEIWDELDSNKPQRRQLVIDADMNASMAERRTIMGLWGREVTMTIGMPLLLCLDEPALRSVIAHEIGHSELRHTSGLSNLAEFEATFETLFEYADPNTTITGAMTYSMLGGLGSWLEKEMLYLSRQHEFEADRAAADSETASIEARSNLLCEAVGEFYLEEILKPIDKEILGAISAPRSPLLQLIDRLDEVRDPKTIMKYARRSWKKDPDPKSTHPTLKERIEALGFIRLPVLKKLNICAANALLPSETKSKLIRNFDEQWIEQIDAYVRLE